MKQVLSTLLLAIALCCPKIVQANEPDSAFLFAYTTANSGLHLAWSIDQKQWHDIGGNFSFVNSDYGAWGSEKKMFNPVLTRGADGTWHAIWSVNSIDPTFAYAHSKNLINWIPQWYPILTHNANCLEPEISVKDNGFLISWISDIEGKKEYFTTTTNDFRTYSKIEKTDESVRINQVQKAIIKGVKQVGTVNKTAWNEIDNIIKHVQLSQFKNERNNEQMSGDAARFPDLKPLKATIKVNIEESKTISDKLLGIFFEDINYAADGGIYAELVQNRGFEYHPSENWREKNWNSKKAWELVGENASFDIATEEPLHENNPHYALVKIEQVGAALQNEGFNGIAIKAGEQYELSFFAKTLAGKNGKFIVKLVNEDGETFAQSTTKSCSNKWSKLTTTLKASKTTATARLQIIPQEVGSVAMDMISLFPQNTFKQRKNGMRADLAQTLADMKPKFVRFPGGCVAHGNGIDNIYHWKYTVGPLETRKPLGNLWGYHQSMGLGYYEYFQFCEDIGAHPVPIVAAGVPCQNSKKHNCAIGGQQGGIPMCEMDNYIQDIFDLIEWANGDPKTNKWAKMRADAGHPKTFNLKYLGVGNEDLISDVFEERFEMIYKAIQAKYPEIIVIGTSGPWSEGSDYERGWQVATDLKVPIVDEHYYQTPGWYIHNQDYYDRYDRNKSKVYLGEYAAHLPGRPNNIETALLEALHLINIERNGDIVEMTSYAPLLAKEGYTQWHPDLIYFNNTEVKPTVGYYVQQLFGIHAGDQYFSNFIDLSDKKDGVVKRVACSVTKDSKTNDIIVKLANLLPTTVETTLDLGIEFATNATVKKIELTSEPSDKTAKPTTSIINLSDMEQFVLPAYSFTVLRVSTPIATKKK